MAFVGNDIIDIETAFLLEKEQDEKWINKVFTIREQQYIYNTHSPKLTLWKLWSCKESAYKVIVKRQNKRFLNPKRIEIFSCDVTDCHFAAYEDMRLLTSSNCTKQYIHTVCTANAHDLDKVVGEVFRYPELSQSSGSKEIRGKMVRKISLSIGAFDFSFHKDKFGIPSIQASSLEVNIDISFSHDEPHFAYVYLV